MRFQDVSWSVVLLVVFWGAAFLVALNDIDFFTFQDLFDTTDLHHEHIVAALVVVGIVAAVIPLIRRGRRDQAPQERSD